MADRPTRYSPMIIGLTGRYCAGKDSAARALASRGYRIIDADSISHEVLVDRSFEVIAQFGPGVRAADGGVDRRALGRIVFADPAARARLESIMHPRIVARIRQLLAAAPGDVVINAPLLHRAGLHLICNAVIFVRAPALQRLLRAMRRDSLSLRDAWARIRSQDDVRPQSNGSAVDTYSVPNWGSARALERRIARLDRRLRG
jgi:dephospho-CoA kinase